MYWITNWIGGCTMQDASIDYSKLYFGEDYKINDYITIHHPTIQEILDMGEQQYYSMVYTLCSIPSDMKSKLWDLGIDYEEISDFEFFILLTRGVTSKETYPLFGELDLSTMEVTHNPENGEPILRDGNVIIDRFIYQKMFNYICTMHGIKPKIEHAANKYTKKILIQDDRDRIARNEQKPYSSTLLPLISSMINSPGFKYKASELKEVPIYQFMDSVQRMQIIKTADALTAGSHSFCDLSKVPKENFNWMRDLNKKD